MARSQSAAGVARPTRARSKSPRRSLSPPNDRDWRYTGAARGASSTPPTNQISHTCGPPRVRLVALDVELQRDPTPHGTLPSRNARSLVASAHHHFTATYCFNFLALFHLIFFFHASSADLVLIPDKCTLSLPSSTPHPRCDSVLVEAAYPLGSLLHLMKFCDCMKFKSNSYKRESLIFQFSYLF